MHVRKEKIGEACLFLFKKHHVRCDVVTLVEIIILTPWFATHELCENHFIYSRSDAGSGFPVAREKYVALTHWKPKPASPPNLFGL